MSLAEFTTSQPLTLGVELELQLVSTHDFDLAPQAEDLLRVLAKHTGAWDVKPEITRSMIEIGTSIQREHGPLLAELHDLRRQLSDGARKLNIAIGGGGTHPYQHWSAQQIFPTERFHYISELYGYLAKQFTVFGQHIHVGCADGDDALYLLHAFSRYLPQFIALSASSPFYQGVDTAFDSSRLNAVFAFPLSGRAPFALKWSEFTAYFERMSVSGIVESMKDFYWDVRPKPEFGTIEIRVCDTPLTVERAAALAAYAQAICRWLLVERPDKVSEDNYLAYTYNRFQACRFGLEGEVIDPAAGVRRTIAEDIAATLQAVSVHARELDCEAPLQVLGGIARDGNDARWMREAFADGGSLADLVWQQGERFRRGG